MGREPAICEKDEADITNLLVKFLCENNATYPKNCVHLYFWGKKRQKFALMQILFM